MTGLEVFILLAAVGLLTATSPRGRRAVGWGGRRGSAAAVAGARAGARRIAARRANRAATIDPPATGPAGPTTAPGGGPRPAPRGWRGVVRGGARRVRGWIWAPAAPEVETPEVIGGPPPAAPTPPVPPSPPPVPRGTTSIAGGALVVGPGNYVRLDGVIESVGAAVDEFRALTRAIKAIGEVEIDPQDPLAVEALEGWLTGLRASLVNLAAAVGEFAEQADQALRLDPRVTVPIYDLSADLADLTTAPQLAVKRFEELYEPQLAAMRAKNDVRDAAVGLFERQSA